MNTLPVKPVYKLLIIESEATEVQWTNFKPISVAIGNGWIILWQHHGVFTGLIKDNNIKWLNEAVPIVNDDAHIVRIRAFNEAKEYHFWKSGNLIKGRLRNDKTGKSTEYVDANMILRSVVAKPLKAVLPYLQEGNLSVITRNYVGYHPETNQAGYVDSRFVDFKLQNFERNEKR